MKRDTLLLIGAGIAGLYAFNAGFRRYVGTLVNPVKSVADLAEAKRTINNAEADQTKNGQTLKESAEFYLSRGTADDGRPFTDQEKAELKAIAEKPIPTGETSWWDLLNPF